MRWAAFLTLLLCSGGGLFLVMTWLAHNGARQRHTLDRRLVLGHSIGGIVGLAVFGWGMVRGNGDLLRTATEVTSAVFVAGGLLVAGWLWRQQQAAWAAADTQRDVGDKATIAADTGEGEAMAIGTADAAASTNGAGNAILGFRRVRRLRLVFSAAAESDGDLVREQEPLQLVAGDEGGSVASAANPAMPPVPRGRGRRHLRIVAVGAGESEVETRPSEARAEAVAVHEAGKPAEPVEDEADTAEVGLGDLSFAAAAFDWRAVGVHDDGTPADAHLPLAIVVAHGVTAFAALVFMFAAMS